MSTRGLYGFRVNEEYKLEFSPTDSYPAGLGLDVKEFIQQHTYTELKTIANALEAINEYDLEKVGIDPNVAASISDWNDPTKLYYVDAKEFMKDHCFCEWVYIIDIDKKRLEVYNRDIEPLITYLLTEIDQYNPTTIKKLAEERYNAE